MSRIKEILRSFIPEWRLIVAAVLSSVIAALAFPDVGMDFLVLVSLSPILVAVVLTNPTRRAAFVAGWISGFLFFFLTCWWLAHAPIEYAGVNPLIAYFLIAIVCGISALFPALFLMLMAGLLKRFGSTSLVAAPFVWLLTDFLRYWITGNNWNSLGYALAFSDFVRLSAFGGVALLTFLVASMSTAFALVTIYLLRAESRKLLGMRIGIAATWSIVVVTISVPYVFSSGSPAPVDRKLRVVTVQPNVPMSGLTAEQYRTLLAKHFKLAGDEIAKIDGAEDVLVVFPESPMLFRYGSDEALRSFFARYALTNDVSLMFNSTEWTEDSTGLTNSALVVAPTGKLAAKYDKYYLLPFGEFSPLPGPLEDFVPSFVGSFTPGKSTEPIEVGALRAGVMICFESHFGSLGRTYATSGADLLIEMTNDGYLGNTPVLRQHLANSVVRAVESGLPLVRSTNVGITALITPDGKILDEAPVYTEASRQWLINASKREPTPYTSHGEVFFWFCSAIGLALSFLGLRKGRTPVRNSQ